MIKAGVSAALTCIVCIVTGIAVTYAAGIGTLIDVSKSMDAAKKQCKAETDSYGRVKKAIDEGLIRDGLAKETVSAQFGDPVVANMDHVTGRERWVYKPASSTFFGGSKICLYFDSKGMLDEIRQTGN
jgi:hypothetical protein